MFALFNLIAAVVLGFIDGVLGGFGGFGTLYLLAVFIPNIAVSVRRLHDSGRSGWWLLLGLVPLIGGLVLLYFMVQDSEAGDNAFGENPKLAEV